VTSLTNGVHPMSNELAAEGSASTGNLPGSGVPPPLDERSRQLGPFARIMRRPDFGALIGVAFTWMLFAWTGGTQFASIGGTVSYLSTAAELGIIAVPVALLMIGGEFDLSVGSMVGAGGMIMTLLAVSFSVPLWLAVLIALVFGATFGLLSAWITVRTNLPSFIVTLAGFFILRGLTIALTRLITGRTQVSGLDQVSGHQVASIFTAHIGQFNVTLIWWIGLVAFGAWVLTRTSFGNWITAVGGSEEGARNSGVPVIRVKFVLFAATGLAAALLGIIQCLEAGSADTLRGQGKEFEAIIAAVIGGNLLAGGYGSVMGAALGALTFAIVRQGIFFTGLDTDWFQVILGSLLLVAVLANNSLRQRALKAR